MTNDKQLSFEDILPKKTRDNFFILSAFLFLLLVSSFAILNASHNISPSADVKSGLDAGIPYIMIGISLILSIIGFAKKSYGMLATLGCSLLLAAFSYSTFGKNYFDFELVVCLILSAAPPLILAINMSICQLGSPQTAHIRLCYAYVFVPFCTSHFFRAAEYTDNSPGYNSMIPIPVLELIPTTLALLTLLLWLVCMKKKIWTATLSEEEIKPKPALPIIEKMAILLIYILTLSSLWISIFLMDNKIFDLVKLPFCSA